MPQTNPTPGAPPHGKPSTARVIPLRLCTEPPASMAPPAVAGDATPMFLRMHVRYDIAAVAQVIAPILDYNAESLAHELRAGPVVDGPHPRADAVALASTLGHFGVACEIEAVQSLGQMPTVQAMNPSNPVGRYVYGASQSSAGAESSNDKAGVGQ